VDDIYAELCMRNCCHLRVRNGKVIDGQKGMSRGKDRVGDKGSWFFETALQGFGLSRYRNGIG
jgi:hypothetical protein